MLKISQDETNDKKRAGKASGTFGCFSLFNWLPIRYPKGQGRGRRRGEKGKLERKIKQVDRTYVKGKIDWSVLLKWADWKIVGRDTHKHTRSENAGEWSLCPFARGSADTHIHQAAITHHHPTKKINKKKEREEEGERKASHCYQHKNKQQHSLVCQVERDADLDWTSASSRAHDRPKSSNSAVFPLLWPPQSVSV